MGFFKCEGSLSPLYTHLSPPPSIYRVMYRLRLCHTSKDVLQPDSCIKRASVKPDAEYIDQFAVYHSQLELHVSVAVIGLFPVLSWVRDVVRLMRARP